MNKFIIILISFSFGLIITNAIYSSDSFWKNDELRKLDLARISYIAGCLDYDSIEKCKKKSAIYESTYIEINKKIDKIKNNN